MGASGSAPGRPTGAGDPSRSGGGGGGGGGGGVGPGEADDPCDAMLDAYLGCVEGHDGVAPREYEGEWCEGEKNLYIDCRRKWAKERRARLKHAVKVEPKPWEMARQQQS